LALVRRLHGCARMRIFVLTVTLLVLCGPADARPRKRTRAHTPTAPVHVVPNDRAAKESARAEAELADVRAGRIGEDSQSDPVHEPTQAMTNQQEDREVPAPLRKKR
jgi:hypothetical protein